MDFIDEKVLLQCQGVGPTSEGQFLNPSFLVWQMQTILVGPILQVDGRRQTLAYSRPLINTGYVW